ncbi:MAG: hypothetical protein Q4D93_00535 [Porphyromonas sp.]|nr:hypothetical protein [Porphyromonas sp.]
MKRILTLLLTLILTITMVGAQVPDIERVKRHLDTTDGLMIEYLLTIGDYAQSGIYYGAGKKFYLESMDIRAWYDGGNLWLYVAQNGEINLTTPQEKELGELNPLLSLESLNHEDYMIAQNNGILTVKPKKSGSNTFEWMKVAIDSHSRPLWIEVKEQGLEGHIRVDIKKIQKGSYPEMHEKGFFSFEPNKLPGIEVIDLR